MNKIMIAEDDKEILEVMKTILEMEDFEVLAAKKDERILDTVRKEKPDLLLLDVWIWDQDGREVCRNIKSIKEVKDTKVVIVSASQDLEKNSLDCNADGFMKKPFEINELINMVKKYCHQKTI